MKNTRKKPKVLKQSSKIGLTGPAENLAEYLKECKGQGTLGPSPLPYSLIVGPVITGEHQNPLHGSDRYYRPTAVCVAAQGFLQSPNYSAG